MKLPVKVVRTGLDLPPRIETAEELAKQVGKSEHWIRSRVGVQSRHVSDEDMATMGAKAARQAIGTKPPPDLILNASAVPRQLIPDSSVFIQHELGYEGIPSHSIHATCLSFLVALHTAACYIKIGAYQRILVVSAELGTAGRNYANPESAVLFGDGAAAALIEPTPLGEKSCLLAWCMHTWPSGADLSEVRGCGTRNHPNSPTTRPEDNLFSMDGPSVYRMARKNFPAVLEEALHDSGLSIKDLDLVVPHQASLHGVKAFRYLGIPDDKVINVFNEYGNCVAASLPMALATAHAQGRLHRGDKVLLAGTGAGLSAAVAILQW